MLLFDQNLSPKIVATLGADIPGSLHVRDLGMSTASDTEIWNIVKERSLCIVSKDADFHQRSLLLLDIRPKWWEYR